MTALPGHGPSDAQAPADARPAADDPVTVLYSRRVKPGREADFEAWARSIVAAARQFPGHLGASVLDAPGSREYHILFTFADRRSLQAWLDSEERRRWLAQVGELLKAEAKIDIVHVPYKGAAPAVNDLLGGQVQMMFAGISTVLQHLKSGKLVAIAIASPQRSQRPPASGCPARCRRAAPSRGGSLACRAAGEGCEGAAAGTVRWTGAAPGAVQYGDRGAGRAGGRGDHRARW